jgi:hypothetical protein
MSLFHKNRWTKRKLSIRLLAVSRLSLAAFLASWFGLLPLAQSAHIAFANHDHRICYKHHRFEDIPRVNDLDRYTALQATDLALSADTQQRQMQPEIACSILNCTTASDPSLAVHVQSQCDALDSLDLSVFEEPGSFVPHGSRLFTAPKTSPPTATA